MTLDNQTTALIAVGASVVANCQHCLEFNAGTALQYGATSQQIAEAVEIGRRLRLGAASGMDRFASTLADAVDPSTGAVEGTCGCASSTIAVEVENG
jgi:AhpD family alkylhydroperoxidase